VVEERVRRAGDRLCAGVGNLGRIARSCRSDSSSWIVSVTVAMLGGSAGALQRMPRAGIVEVLFALDFRYGNGLCNSPLDAIPCHPCAILFVESLECSQKSADSEDCQESTNGANRRDDIARHFLLRLTSTEPNRARTELCAMYPKLYSNWVTLRDKDYSGFAHDDEMQDKRSDRFPSAALGHRGEDRTRSGMAATPTRTLSAKLAAKLQLSNSYRTSRTKQVIIKGIVLLIAVC
jgi:hypothetical protein